MADRIDELKAALADRYRIESEIGRGGMATVYLAQDLRHNRQVAVKVLRPDLAAALGHDRFLREIEIAANLTHPHILPLYDSGEADGFLYYVMPYIKGSTLRDRIEKEGELPVTESVRIMKEVADALSFAHQQGVVHRDIKPDNIMLSGRHAMVTDFGVAKAVSEATGRNQLTTAGVALGTPAYMSPEQATADQHVDHRSDIYALGAVGYELLTGRAPFIGKTPQAVLAAHVTEQVDPVSKHRDQVSPELEAVIMRCLAKKPADRWQSADELMPYLETMTTSSGGLTPTSTRPVSAYQPGRRQRLVWMGIGGVAVVAFLAVFGARILRDEPLRVTVSGVRQLTHSPALEIFPEISSDGREVAYSVGSGVSYDVAVLDAASGASIVLTADEPGAQMWPWWSSSGSEIRYLSGNINQPDRFGVIERPRLGGAGRRLPNTLLVDNVAVEIHLADGDSLEVREKASGRSWKIDWPLRDVSFEVPSPDGSLLAFSRRNGQYYRPDLLGNDVPTSIWITPLDEFRPVRITPEEGLDVHPVWIGNDKLMFVSNRDGRRDIYLVELEASGEPAGPPVRVTTGADVHTMSATPDGHTVAYSRLQFRSNLYQLALSPDGPVSVREARPLTRESALIEQHDRSDDGATLVYDSDIRGQQDIYLRAGDETGVRRITSDPGQDMDPDLSPDGTELVFYSTRRGTRDVYIMDLAGQDPRPLVPDGVELPVPAGEEYFPEFSPDGNHIGFMTTSDFFRVVLLVASRDSSGGWTAPRVVADSVGPFFTWTPDGNGLLYTTIDAGLAWTSLAGSAGGDVPTGLVECSWPSRAPDGSVYFKGRDSNGAEGLYRLRSLNGGAELVVALDDPTVAANNFSVSVRGTSLILTVDEKESDIYLMELEF